MIALMMTMTSRKRGKLFAAIACWAPAAALALALPGAPRAQAAPPVPSIKAPHPPATVVRAAGMILEVRRGRVVVTDVARGSPADRAGILPLDVLLVVNGRSLVDLDPVTPQQVLGLLQYEQTLRTRIVLGRGAGTLSVDLPQDPGETWTAPVEPVELRPGMEAPPFSGLDLKGKEVALLDLRGRPVLIDFWASTCPPCLKNAIPLRRIADQHAGLLTIVGVSLDEDRRAFEAFAYNQHLPGIQIFDGGGWRGPIARLYGVAENGIPRYVLLDPDGRIVSIAGLQDLEDDIARLVSPREP
jgi:peroxiredoxin